MDASFPARLKINLFMANDHLITWTDALERSDSVVYDIDRSRLFEQVVDEFGSHENQQGALW